MAWTRKTRLL